MPNNNANGVNGWEGFGTEEPYGQATQDKALAAAAPLAGGKVAAGRIAAPQQAQRQAAKPSGVPRAAFGVTPEAPPTIQPPIDAAATWQQIASTPGAENYPILSYYAAAQK